MKLTESTELSSTEGSLAVHTEQPASVQEGAGKDATMGFFVIGGAINIVMILAYFVWAVRQWKTIDKKTEKK